MNRIHTWPTWRGVLVGLACFSGLIGLGIAQELEQEGGAPGSRELFVEALSPTGEVITGQVSAALEVLEDGRLVAVRDEGEVGDGWRIVLYFDQLLASATDFHNATLHLAEHASQLTALGEVEVLLAADGVVSALPPTRDADALEQALGWLRLRETAQGMQADMRREFLEDLGLGLESEGEEPERERDTSLDLDRVQERLAVNLTDEVEILQMHREQLLIWAVENATPGPKAFFLVGSGFDADPADFYRVVLTDSPWREAADAAVAVEIEPSVGAVAQALSVFDWTVLSYVPATQGDALLEESDEEIKAREEEEKTDVIFQDGRLVDRTTIGFDPAEMLKRRRQRQAEEAAQPVLLDAETPYRRMAEASGGELLSGRFQLTSSLERLAKRHRLIMAEASDVESEVRGLDLHISPRAESEVASDAVLRARRWVSDVTPEIVSTVRARQILRDQLDDGDIVISAAVQPGSSGTDSRLIVKRDTWLEPGEAESPLRVTVARAADDGPIEVLHMQRPSWHLDMDEESGEGEPTLEMSYEGGMEGILVVLVEELDSGAWGGTFASVLEASSTMGSSREPFDALVLPAPQLIHLLAPSQGFAMGRTQFETVVSTRSVARVDFVMDGQIEMSDQAAPFAASLDLGSLPQPRRVEVIAYDDSGRELGRDYLIVNEGSGVFGVRIVKPEATTEDGMPKRLSGPVDVEAEVEPRSGQGIDRVEFYWTEELVATRYAQPFKQRVVIPPEAPAGFLRVVAYLEDGASSEDVVFVNSPGSSDRLQVNLMELYVVVTDRHGRPASDLSRDLFRVTEEGEPQKIATFSDAGDLPLTVGMVIDSSASMFVKLPDVQFAAAEFLRGLATRRDRAFVVGFGSEPAMTRSTTSDLPAVIQSLDVLQPDGQTAIWKAIVYSLVQLQGVPGKKALVVYTDGADEDPDFSYRTCLNFARKVGVPIYVILSNNEIRRTEGKGLSVRGFLDRLESLTESVGGRVFMARVGEDLDKVYREIDEELRSQYVVGYYSRDTGGTEWRRVDVDVARAGFKARTIAGYYR